MKRLIPLLVITLLWVGCEKENTSIDTSTVVEEQQVTLRGQNPRPFKGTIVYNFVPSSDLQCDCSGANTVLLEGTGNITHLGLVSSPAVYCVELGAQNCTVGNTVVKECLYIIAANGDELHLQVDTPYESCLDVGCCWTGSIQGTFDGGTGRFANATGDWTADFIQYEGSPTSEVTVDGDIIY